MEGKQAPQAHMPGFLPDEHKPYVLGIAEQVDEIEEVAGMRVNRAFPLRMASVERLRREIDHNNYGTKAEAIGCGVTEQAVRDWKAGRSSPRAAIVPILLFRLACPESMFEGWAIPDRQAIGARRKKLIRRLFIIGADDRSGAAALRSACHEAIDALDPDTLAAVAVVLRATALDCAGSVEARERVARSFLEIKTEQ